MYHTRGNVTGETAPADAFAGIVDAALIAGGMTFVEQLTSGNERVNVYLSEDSANSQGVDWYFYLRWNVAAGQNLVRYGVSELWDTGATLATRVVPYTTATRTSLTSGAAVDADNDFTRAVSVNPVTVSLTSTSGMLFVESNVDTVATLYEISVSPDRVVIGTATSAPNYRTVYLGLLESTLPDSVASGNLQLAALVLRNVSDELRNLNTSTSASTTAPQVSGSNGTSGAAGASATSSSSGANSDNTVATCGGFTREPGSLTTHRGNFVAAMYDNESYVGFSGRQDLCYSVSWYTAAKIVVYSTRLFVGQTATNYDTSPRGLLIDVKSVRLGASTFGFEFEIGDTVWASLQHTGSFGSQQMLIPVGPVPGS
jgi:hypothetical protein